MDVLCYDDLDEFGRDLNDPLSELEQDVVHMLLEAPGSNCSAPEQSIGLDDALSAPVDPHMKHRIERKLTDDPRIEAASVAFTAIDNQTIKLDLAVQVNGAELGIAIQIDAAGNVVRA